MTDDLDRALAALQDGYLRDRRQDVQQMRAHLAAGRLAEVKRTAHRIRGTGTTYGFADLTRLGEALEAAAETGDADRTRARLDDLERWLAERAGAPGGPVNEEN